MRVACGELVELRDPGDEPAGGISYHPQHIVNFEVTVGRKQDAGKTARSPRCRGLRDSTPQTGVAGS